MEYKVHGVSRPASGISPVRKRDQVHCDSHQRPAQQRHDRAGLQRQRQQQQERRATVAPIQPTEYARCSAAATVAAPVTVSTAIATAPAVSHASRAPPAW